MRLASGLCTKHFGKPTTWGQLWIRRTILPGDFGTWTPLNSSGNCCVREPNLGFLEFLEWIEPSAAMVICFLSNLFGVLPESSHTGSRRPFASRTNNSLSKEILAARGRLWISESEVAVISNQNDLLCVFFCKLSETFRWFLNATP